MPLTTLSPQARIAAVVGVLLFALAGSAYFVLHGHSQPATIKTPVVHHHPTTTPPVHVVAPTVNPLLPGPVHAALEHGSVVVVGFYNPHSPVDQLTMAQARAGAAGAHVAFVAVNLLDDSVAGPLTALLPSGQLLPNPGFVIYKRPGMLVFRSDGYLDHVAVAQAVKDSR